MKKITQAVILAGGKGTRLLPHTLTVPKPMMPINDGKPFLEYLIEDLKKNGITEVILLVGYLHETIEAYFGNGKSFGVSITYSYNSIETETGSRLKSALPLLQDTFLLLYGDNIFPFKLSEAVQSYTANGKKVQMTIYTNRDNATKNNVIVTDHLVRVYSKKRDQQDLQGVNIGYFIFDKSVLQNLPEYNFSLDEIISRLVDENELSAYTTDHKYYSLTSAERLPKLQEYLREKKVVFLDRDGVINKKAEKAEYITKWKDFVFLPHVKEALRLLQEKGYILYIITNQPGIARGMMTAEDLENIHTNLLQELKKEGIGIEQIYVCPHGWDEGCWCRKPSPGMLFMASYEHPMNLHNTTFIGDDIRDKQTGDAVGCTTYLVTQESNLFAIVQRYL